MTAEAKPVIYTFWGHLGILGTRNTACADDVPSRQWRHQPQIKYLISSLSMNQWISWTCSNMALKHAGHGQWVYHFHQLHLIYTITACMSRLKHRNAHLFLLLPASLHHIRPILRTVTGNLGSL